MFYREKENKSGSIRVQVLEKRNGKNRLIKTIGCTQNASTLAMLRTEAKQFILQSKQQLKLPIEEDSKEAWFAEVLGNIERIELVGPEQTLGLVYDSIGFQSIQEPLLRQLVLARLVYPYSKLKTVRYLNAALHLNYDVQQLYRYLDKLQREHKEQIERLSFEHTKKLLGGELSVVFYDVTTLYFETDEEDELRISGFSKDGKHKHPQILLGLLVSIDGYPIGYDFFEGNKYEGHTMLPVLEHFTKKYNLEKVIVVADSGLLTKTNIEALESKGYEYILGARIKNETSLIKKQILDLKLKDGQSRVLHKSDHQRLVIHYSERRANKDSHNRKRGLKRLEKSLNSGKLTKNNINNRGYNKYLKMEGKIEIIIDYDKYQQDAVWDGLKGYITNTKLDEQTLLNNYRELWKIEKAFRIAKTDLKVRPIYHRLRNRIEAHLCIAFIAYKIYKEIERVAKKENLGFSINRIFEIVQEIRAVTVVHPHSLERRAKNIFPSLEHQIVFDFFQKYFR